MQSRSVPPVRGAHARRDSHHLPQVAFLPDPHRRGFPAGTVIVIPPADVQRSVDDQPQQFLAERQAALERPRPPMMLVVMDESCVRRPIGGPKVMNAQLDRLT